jgi:hypothetical protein
MRSGGTSWRPSHTPAGRESPNACICWSSYAEQGRSQRTPAVCRRRAFHLSPDAQRQLARLAVGRLLVVFLAQCLVLVRANAPTYDEGTHIASGYSNLARRDFRLEQYNPPLINMLQASVLFFAYRLPSIPRARTGWRGPNSRSCRVFCTPLRSMRIRSSLSVVSLMCSSAASSSC